MITTRLRPYGTTIFSEMTRLAQQHGAINLAQGFPDFDGPAAVVDAAIGALRTGHHQYARSMGVPLLVEAVAEHQQRLYGLKYDPLSEVVVFSGATEGIASFMLGFLEPGDEVILFEPFYDSYPVMASLAGATVRPYTLRFPDFAIDFEALERLVTEKTRLIVINTPHNPTGKVFTRAELRGIADVCHRHNLYVLADEVYEHLTYAGAQHIPMASLPGMRERTFTLSSSGKTWSFTGWKIGWGTGAAPLAAAAQAAHQFVTFATSTPLQHAAAHALTAWGDHYFAKLQRDYTARRDFLLPVLRDVGFEVAVPQGAYYVLCRFGRFSNADDLTFAKQLTTDIGVAAIPPSPFYRATPEEGRRLVRFAFCKKMETLERAAERLRCLHPVG
jgi:N-succinyldiaminopimelate aminotransferase